MTTYDFEITSPTDPDEVRDFITPDVVTERSQKKAGRDNRYKNYIIINKLKDDDKQTYLYITPYEITSSTNN